MDAFAVYLLFFLSGISGLVYQVVWVRQFGDVFGNTVHSAATVSGVFLCGLGVGSAAVGRWIDARYRRDRGAPLRAYGCFELGVAGLGLLIALALPSLEPISAAISHYRLGPEGWHELTLGSYLLRYGAALVLLAPITFLMGGTLTLLIRHRVESDLSLAGWRIGALYGVNTLGAACGAFATDFALIPRLGILHTELVAVALNAGAGLGALTVAGRQARRPGATAPSAPAPAAAPPGAAAGRRTRQTGVALLCSGATAMGLQILWFRHLSSTLGSYRAVFSLLLTVILLGIWLGSMLGGWLERRTARPAPLYLGVQTLMVAVSLASLAAFSFHLSPDLRRSWAEASGAGRLWIETWIDLRPILLLAGAPALLMGFAFPLANAHVQRVESAVGSRAGSLYLFNTTGNLLGSLLTGFVLLPLLGSQNSAGLLAAVGALGLCSFHASLEEGHERLRPVFAGCVLTLALALGAWASLPADWLLAQALPPLRAGGPRVLDVSEGVNETVAVLETPGVERRLLTNGHPMSSTHRLAQRYMRLFAHLPLLEMDDPHSVLVICFGVGNTVHAASLHPSVRRLDVVDLSRNVVAHAGWFRDANGDVARDPRVSIYIDDGRQHLRMQPPGSYDLITLEPPPISQAGVSALYSREFYALARSRLTERGALTQWLPAYQVSGEAVRSIVRAFLDVFPDAVLLSGFRSEFILLGARHGPPLLDLPAVRERLAQRDAVRADLARIEVESLTALAGTFVADAATLDAATRGAAAVTDDWPAMEYSVHAQLFETRLPPGLIDVSRVSHWCPSCFLAGRPRPEVAHLPGYLAALGAWYASESFQVHGDGGAPRPSAAPPPPDLGPGALQAIGESAYLREVFRLAESPRLASRDTIR